MPSFIEKTIHSTVAEISALHGPTECTKVHTWADQEGGLIEFESYNGQLYFIVYTVLCEQNQAVVGIELDPELIHYFL